MVQKRNRQNGVIRMKKLTAVPPVSRRKTASFTSAARIVTPVWATCMMLFALLPAAGQNPAVTTQRNYYDPGETVTIVLSELPGNPTDWVAIVPEEAPENTWGRWQYTRGIEDGMIDLPAPMEPGVYQVRLYLDWQGTASYDVADRHTFWVGVDPPEADQPEEPEPAEPGDDEGAPALPEIGGVLVWTSAPAYEPDETVVVHFEGLPGNRTDWINVVPAEASDRTWGDWRYTRGLTEGDLEFPGLPEGRYEVRVYFDWAGGGGYTVQQRHTFFSGPIPEGADAPVATEQSTYAIEQPITVFFRGLPGNDSDWINVVPADATDSTWGDWRYTRGRSEGVMMFNPLPPGEYEVRMYHDWDGTEAYEVQHRHRFTVLEQGQ